MLAVGGGPVSYSARSRLVNPIGGESSGTVLATRSALTGSNRPVPHARTVARETVVRRAYPIAYFPETDVSPDALQRTDYTTRHHDLGLTSWYTVRAGEQSAQRGAWRHIDLPSHASELQARVAFAWPAMDAFYEEDERIIGHAADSYHRIDIRQASRRLVVRHRDRIVADTTRPAVLYESGFAPRWYVGHADVDESALTAVEHQTFCPYKGLCSYYDIGDARLAAWSYRDAYAEVSRISGLVSFEPDIVSIQLDGTQLRLAPGQTVIPHGPDRELTVTEVLPARKRP